MSTEKTAAPRLTTPEFRGSYVTVCKARAIEEGQEPKFSIVIVLPKTSKETVRFIKRLEGAFSQAMVDKFGKVLPPGKLKHYPIKDGDDEDNDAHAGCYVIRASSRFKPQCVDIRGEELIGEEQLYSGAYYRVSVSAWAWSHKTGGKGVSVNLHNVLFVKDGERFGGSGTSAADEFAEHIGGVSSDDDDDEDDEPVAPKKKRAPVVEDDEDEDDEPAPPKKKKKRAPVVEDDEDEDED